MKSLCLVGLFSALSIVQVCAQSSSRFSREIFVGPQGDTLQYRQLYPDADPLRKYPLVIFLHGSGERGNDNEAQLKWGVQNFATDQNMVQYPALVIAPQCPSGMGWSNMDWTRNSNDIKLRPEPAKPMALLRALIQKLVTSMPVDSNRIYITGLSMGGLGTFDAIERYPNLFAAAVPVCGGGDVSKAPLIAHLPIWIFHGSEDPSVPVALSQEMLQALTKAGAHPGYTQYPETGHFSWLAAYSDAHMLQWMFRQHK